LCWRICVEKGSSGKEEKEEKEAGHFAKLMSAKGERRSR
jgi:hypothetical protein